MSSLNLENDSEDEFESADEGETADPTQTSLPVSPPASPPVSSPVSPSVSDKIVTPNETDQVQHASNTIAATEGWEDWNIDDDTSVQESVNIQNDPNEKCISCQSIPPPEVDDNISLIPSNKDEQSKLFKQQCSQLNEYGGNLAEARSKEEDDDRKTKEMSQLAKTYCDETLSSSSTAIAATKHNVKDAHQVLDQLSAQSSKHSSTWLSSWNNFGSLVSTAKLSVSTLKSTVSEGFNAVIESVEAGLGAPDPQKLAEMNRMAFEIKGETSDSEDEPEVSILETTSQDLVSNQDGWLSALSIEKLTNTGIKVVSGSLDVLESVGKKTFDVITEADREFNGKRRLFKRENQPTLSEIIRETKNEKSTSSIGTNSDIMTFLQLFEKHQGLAHFEALELLSNQASIVLQTLSYGQDDILKQVNQYFKVKDDDDGDDDDDDDFETNNQFKSLSISNDNRNTQVPTLNILSHKFTAYQTQLRSTVPIDKLLEVYESAHQFIQEWDWMDTELDQQTLADEAIDTLAILCSRIIEYYRRTAELFLMGCKSLTSFSIDIELLTIYEKQQKDFSCMLAGIPNLFANCMKNVSNISTSVTDLPKRCDLQLKQKLLNQMFIQSSSSQTYASDAYMLLKPIVSQSILYHTSILT